MHLCFGEATSKEWGSKSGDLMIDLLYLLCYCFSKSLIGLRLVDEIFVHPVEKTCMKNT